MDLGEEVEELRVEAVVAEVVRLGGGGRGERDSSSTHGRRSLLPHRDTALSASHSQLPVSYPLCAVRRQQPASSRSDLQWRERNGARQLCVSGIWKRRPWKLRSRCTFLGKAYSNRFYRSKFLFVMRWKRRGCLGSWWVWGGKAIVAASKGTGQPNDRCSSNSSCSPTSYPPTRGPVPVRAFMAAALLAFSGLLFQALSSIARASATCEL